MSPSRHIPHRKPECTTTQHRSRSTHARRYTRTRTCAHNLTLCHLAPHNRCGHNAAVEPRTVAQTATFHWVPANPPGTTTHTCPHTHSRLHTIKKEYPWQPFQTWIHNWNTFPRPSPHMSAHTTYKYPGRQAPTRHPCPLVSSSRCPPSPPLHAPLGKKGSKRRNETAALCTLYS